MAARWTGWGEISAPRRSAAKPLGGFVAALALHLAQHDQDLLREDGCDGALAKRFIYEIEQPAQLLHGDGGAAFALDLHEPFFGNRLETVC